ncbi:TMCO1 [Mytilus coruscus]|uniref:TMCO1 n=1 Tax=Mytilus coruscus TaxID=42192 RepID=A0A6J8AS21_MYTCO|nr:TMCO1 [Mytilus coruscus]
MLESTLEHNICTDSPISISEVKNCIKELKSGKIAGPDLISNEIIQFSSIVTVTAIVKLCNLILSSAGANENVVRLSSNCVYINLYCFTWRRTNMGIGIQNREVQKTEKLKTGKMEKKKESGESTDRNQKKKIERQEEKLKNNNRDLSFVKMKSMFAIGFAFTALLSMFNSIFDGRVVAKLPFTPISLLQVCTMSIRQNIQKILGLSPSRAASKQGGGLFSPPTQLTK